GGFREVVDPEIKCRLKDEQQPDPVSLRTHVDFYCLVSLFRQGSNACICLVAGKRLIGTLLDEREKRVGIELWLPGQVDREYLLSFKGRQYLLGLRGSVWCLAGLGSGTGLCAREPGSANQRSCYGNSG